MAGSMYAKKFKARKSAPKPAEKALYIRNAIRAGALQAKRSTGTVATAGQVQPATTVNTKYMVQKRRLIFPQERKWFQYNGTTDFGIKSGAANTYGARGQVINLIAQGTSDNQRVGSRIFMTGVRVNYQVRESNAAISNADNIFDIYLLYYKSGTYSTTNTVNTNSYDITNPALQPTEIAQFLLPDPNTTGGAAAYAMVTTNSLRNPNFLANYKVLAQQRCAIPQGSTNTALNQVTGTISWKGTLPVHYMDTSPTDYFAGQGKLVVLVVCNDNGATRADTGTSTYLTLAYNAITYYVDN